MLAGLGGRRFSGAEAAFDFRGEGVEFLGERRRRIIETGFRAFHDGIAGRTSVGDIGLGHFDPTACTVVEAGDGQAVEAVA